jgi:hypothetical protein
MSLEFVSELPLHALRNSSAVAKQNERSCLVGSCETFKALVRADKTRPIKRPTKRPTQKLTVSVSF